MDIPFMDECFLSECGENITVLLLLPRYGPCGVELCDRCGGFADIKGRI